MNGLPITERIYRWFLCKITGHIPSDIFVPNKKGQVPCIRCWQSVKVQPKTD